MHFSKTLIVAAAAFLLPLAYADKADEVVADASSSASSLASSATSGIPKPSFTPATIKAPFLEQFDGDWESRWKPSNAKKAKKNDAEEEWAYVGEWAVEEPTVFKGIEGDKGLVLKNRAAHHAISAKFPKVIDNKGKTLVVQYEVKLQDGLECGGAYLKLLQDNKALHAEEFSNASPYIIMFGPDKCGSTNKVHFIFRHKNPKTGEYEEKHLEDTPHITNNKLSHLYQLIVHSNQSYAINIDGEEKSAGTLLDGFSPAVNPPKEIDDPDDKKPDTWVDKAKIPDPDATKPDDWDEDAPMEIVDDESEKPSDWLDSEPAMIPDPEAGKPEDWDDEEDGDWVPAQVPNPKCEEVSGCGPWEKPMRRNPDYKGKWTAPMIDNPEYKGAWKPRKMPNPGYFDDKTPSNFEPMGAIGIELWTMQKDILFDNIYIGHSTEDAAALKKETWDIKFPIEEKEEEASEPEEKPEQSKKPGESTFMEDPVGYAKEKIDLFVTIAQRDPVEAIKFVPEVAGAIGVGIVSVLALLFSLIGAGSKSPAVQDAAKKAKDAAVDAKDKAAEGVASGVDKASDEVKKRTTRSSGSPNSSS